MNLLVKANLILISNRTQYSSFRSTTLNPLQQYVFYIYSLYYGNAQILYSIHVCCGYLKVQSSLFLTPIASEADDIRNYALQL